MSAHTPAPWIQSTSDITPLLKNYVVSRQKKGQRHVSYLVAACGESEEGEANARLIAAAPRMLEALAAIIDALDVPRNRMGKLTFHPGGRNGALLRELAVRYKVGGSQDAPEQAVKVARAILRDVEEQP